MSDRSLSIRSTVPAPTAILLDHEAARRGLSTSALIRMALTEWLSANVPDADVRTYLDQAVADVRPAPRVSARGGRNLDALAEFLNERTARDATALVPFRAVFDAWESWAVAHDVPPGTVSTFGADVETVAPDLRMVRPRDEQGRKLPRHYRGVTLTPHPGGTR